MYICNVHYVRTRSRWNKNMPAYYHVSFGDDAIVCPTFTMVFFVNAKKTTVKCDKQLQRQS
jgi:hypothetical protein